MQIDGAQWRLISYKVRECITLVIGATTILVFYYREIQSACNNFFYFPENPVEKFRIVILK